MRYSLPWLLVPVLVGAVLGLGLNSVSADIAVVVLVLGAVVVPVRRANRLAAVEREIASLVASTEDAVIGATPGAIITSWNRGAELIYGWTAVETIGRSLEMVVPPERRDAVALSMKQLALGEKALHQIGFGLHRDGHEIDVGLTVCPVFTRGRLTAVSTIARDISATVAADAERERLLGELAEQNTRLRTVDRLKDEFVASVSHELRTPLTSIRGYLELVRDDETQDDERESMLEVVDRNAVRLLSLVNDLLFSAQVAAGEQIRLELDELDLCPLVSQAVEAAGPRAEQGGIALVADIDRARIRCDATRMGQVADNLISNAIKFTPPGGTVRVTLASTDGEVTLTVSDSGVGIAPEEQAQMFSRFYRTEGARSGAIQGTGLGLSIVKSIVDAHGGAVTFESAVGLGTTFVVTMPRAPVAAVTAAVS